MDPINPRKKDNLVSLSASPPITGRRYPLPVIAATSPFIGEAPTTSPH
jgi:hypothetical protein